jgi:hypothetical protein
MVELLSVGSDISKVRRRLDPNLELLEDQETILRIDEYFRRRIDEEEGTDDFSVEILVSKISRFLGYNIFKAFIVNVCKRINRRPFRIACIDAYVIEFLFALQHDDTIEVNTHLEKLFQRIIFGNSTEIMQYAIAPKAYKKKQVSFLRKTFAEIDQNNKEYPFLFALTLRQTSIFDISDFLTYHQKFYRGDFRYFLKLVLEDFNDEKLIFKKQRKLCKKWLTQQFSIEKTPNYLPELPVREGWVIIPGRLKEDALQRFFSFLFLEKDRAGNSLLTKEETEGLLKYGFAYPQQAEVEKRFTLNTGSKLPKWFVYHMFYELYQAHKKTVVAQDYKDHFALFLKHRFTNFEPLTVNMLKNSLRNYEQINSRRRGFDITSYLRT